MTEYAVEGATDLADARKLDATDPLSAFRERFDVPDECYMDGNSLGPVSADAEAALERAFEQWRDLAIRGWTDADPDWFHYGERLGTKTAPLVGADPQECVVANSTTVNIHSLIGAFLDRRDPADGRAILVNELDFPTDHYAIRAQLRTRGLDPEEYLVAAPSRDGRTVETEDVVAAMDAHDVGIVFQPAVLYRSGQLFDVETIAEAAHDRGIDVGFDLAHSIGVVPHDLSAVGVDFAVWCNYKYVNAGPGAVAGLYLAREHFGSMPGLPGWWGHKKETMFEMRENFTPAESAGAYQVGTVNVLSAAPIDGALEVIHDAGIGRIRQKSVALTQYLVDLVDDRLTDRGCRVGTPRDPTDRGGHIAVEHDEAYRLSEALTDRGVVVDFRPPDVVRVCPAPLYTSFEDVWRVVDTIATVLDEGAHREYDRQNGGVT